MTTFDRLIRILEDNFARVDTSTITTGTVLIELNMDSLDRLEFVILLDETFGLSKTLEDDQVDELVYKSRTVGDLIYRIEEVVK